MKTLTNCATLLKAVPESLFRLTYCFKGTGGFFSKLLVYCESGFRKPLHKSAGGF